ncbi:MAG TPA: tripartite tricarboxylate transporter substrate binding protein [Burkholderiales bacterium]|jgi:tripartite-type tricarboxylate transporter receptor subunit TctC
MNAFKPGRLALATLVLAVATAAALAQGYPARPVRVVVPFSPGGVADSSARVLAERLGARLGQPIVVENRPGASGNLGTAAVAAAAPDGYTLLLGFDGTMVINPHVYASLPWNTLRDFAPVTKLGDATLILVAHPSVPAKDLRDLLRLKEKFSYGTAGTGSTPHLAGELLAQRAGLALTHVPYKGGGQAMGDVVGGQIPLVFTAVATAQQFVKSGRLTGLGVPAAKRSASLPDVPTFVESGLEGFVVDSWTGILAPAKTPGEVVGRLQKDIAAVLAEPDVRSRYATLGIEPVGNTPAQFAEQIRADLARWETVVRQANIRIE